MLEFDHLIIGVRDLDAAAARLRREHGLVSVVGGRHPGHGTGNRIVPLGPDYLELMAVVDPEEAAISPLGRFVAGFAAGGDRPMALCLRTNDISSHAQRLGLEPLAMSRKRPDGVELSWHVAGLEEALGAERLPFFIEWHVDPSDHPGRAAASHAQRLEGIAWVEFGGSATAMASRLGEHELDIRLIDADPGPVAVGLRTPKGVLRL